jgi:hypothetical protein
MAVRSVRKLAAGVLACGLAASAPAQGPVSDPIEKARQQRQIAEATAEAQTKSAITTAQGLAKTFPDKAVRDLKATLGTVNAAALSEKKRNELSAQIESAISAIQKGEKATTADAIDPKVLARIRQESKRHDAAVSEAVEVQGAIREIEKEMQAGNEAAVRRKVAALAAKYPNNAAVVTLQAGQPTADAISVAKDISKRSADSFVAALNAVQEAAIPVSRDMTFPKDWKEKMQRRYEANKPKLTPEEQKLIRSLEAKIDSPLKDAPFEEAVQVLSTAIDQKIYLDKRSLEDQGIDLKRPVDVPGGVTARSALRVMLQQQNLTFVVRDNIIQVLSIERAKEVMVQRAYDVRDLVAAGGPFNGPITWGPILDFQQTEANVRMLMESIQKSIDPKVWKDTAGGPATIAFHYPTMSLIVRAPSEVHADLYDKMYAPKK